MSPIIITAASRFSKDDFWRESALGQSLKRINSSELSINIVFNNTQGLPAIYNDTIDAAPPNSILVFMHDDVWVDDYFFLTRIKEGLDRYDAIGVAGNKRRIPNQPAWAFTDTQFTWDDRLNLSGSVAHGKTPFGSISNFGPSPANCELLDGLMLAATRNNLINHNVRFDERFLFDFYDLDFCRTMRKAGLTLGTWPIALTHQSNGAVGTESWQKAYASYLEKWSDTEKLKKEDSSSSIFSGTGAQTPAHEQHNPDLLALIPITSARLVEVGCSSGALAREFKKIKPDCQYVGVEIDPRYGDLARRYCDSVRVGDIETAPESFWDEYESTDCWIFGDALEHMREPWNVLRKIRQLPSNGCVVACIPNMQHWLIQALINAGALNYEDSGLLDRTHLRWFTAKTIFQMFQDAGFRVDVMNQRVLPSPWLDKLTPAIRLMAELQGQNPDAAVQGATPLQYVVRAVCA